MHTNSLLRLFAALALSVILAACGGGGGGGASTPVATVPAPAPAPAPAPPLAYPIPADLWTAPANTVPTTGNYVYLQSDATDYIGAGRTWVYTNADTVTTLANNGLAITVGLKGNENWSGNFLLPSAAGKLQAGYFKGLTRTPFADAAVGGVEWSGEGRGCNTITGWVVIDNITVTGGVMTALDLRFEQHCEGGPAALHGQVHWTQANADSAQMPGPSSIPSGLWKADAVTLPTAGNYLYLESRQGDYIGAGRSYLYTSTNAAFTVTPSGAHVGLRIAGDQNWTGDFQGMLSQSQLSVGYYPGLRGYPAHNPIFGGLSWSGEGRGCSTLRGWFVVDKIAYSGTTPTSIDLRFEQYCDGNAAPLHGQLHWSAADTSTSPGPQLPPSGLWAPPASFVPPAANYVYLVSDSGDYIGGGATQLLTADNATFDVVTNLTAALRINVGGWSGNFVGMNSLSQLQPGYYGGLQRYPFNNALKGGLDWSGNGRGCNTLTGWFVVDKVAYKLAELNAIDLRFEQHCEGGTAALHGVIHWAKP
jgi:hypothetical protein